MPSIGNWPSGNETGLRRALVAFGLLVLGLAAGWLFLNHRVYVVGLLLAFLLFIVFVKEERLGLALLVGYMPFHDVVLAYFPQSLVGGTKELLLFAFGGIWVVKRIVSVSPIVERSRINAAVALLLLAAAMATVKSSGPLVAAVGWKWYFMFLPVYFFAASFDLDEPWLKRMLAVLAAACTLRMLWGFLQYYGSYDLFPVILGADRVVNPPSASGAMRLHWTNVGPYGVVNVFLIIALWTSLDRRYRPLLAAAMAVTLLAVGYTLLRISWLSIILGVLFLGSMRDRRLWALLIIIVLASYLLGPEVFKERIDLMVSPEESYTSAKMGGFFRGWLYIVQHDPFGAGMGSVAAGGFRHLIGSKAASLITTEQGYGDILIDMGIIGLAAYLFLLLTLLREALRIARSAAGATVRSAATTVATIIFIAIIGEGIVEYLVIIAPMFWFLVGAIVAAGKHERVIADA